MVEETPTWCCPLNFSKSERSEHSALKVLCNRIPAASLPAFTFCSGQQSFHQFPFVEVIQGFVLFQRGLILAYVTKSELE